MEGSLNDSNYNSNSSVYSETNGTGSGDSPEQRIAELETALNVVKESFLSYGNKLKVQIRIWACFNVIVLAFGICIGKFLINTVFPETWTWQIVYQSVTRIIIVTAIFAITSICFKIFNSYIHLNEQNTHNITVIESMASLVGAAKDETQRNIIYSKLIDIIIHLGDTGFNTKKPELSNLGNVSLDIIKDIISKK